MLEQLYEQRSSDGLLTHGTYEALGELQGSLVQAAENAVASVLAEIATSEAIFVRVMRELVAIDAAGSRTRRHVSPLNLQLAAASAL